jgi:hypothetical protein
LEVFFVEQVKGKTGILKRLKSLLIFKAYRDENGHPFVFPVVQKAKKQLLNEGGTWANVGPHNFGPFGYDPFIQATIGKAEFCPVIFGN